MVVYGDREIALSLILADDIAVKELFNLTRLGEILEFLLSSFFGSLCFGARELLEELVSSVDALWADVRVDAFERPPVSSSVLPQKLHCFCCFFAIYFSVRVRTRSTIP